MPVDRGGMDNVVGIVEEYAGHADDGAPAIPHTPHPARLSGEHETKSTTQLAWGDQLDWVGSFMDPEGKSSTESEMIDWPTVS